MTEKPQQHCGHERVCPEFRGNDPCNGVWIPQLNEYHGCTQDTRITKHHLITDTRTGKQYTTDLQQLCIDAGLSDRLTYCDIECLLTDGETWYMLDECGNWVHLPSVYKVEEVRG